MFFSSAQSDFKKKKQERKKEKKRKEERAQHKRSQFKVASGKSFVFHVVKTFYKQSVLVNLNEKQCHM